MIPIQILEDGDKVKETDWCRPLYLMTMSGGMSDHYSFKSMYSGTPENNTKWCRVGLILPFWVGSKVKKIKKKLGEFNEWEFVRGDVPKDHIHEDGELKK